MTNPNIPPSIVNSRTVSTRDGPGRTIGKRKPTKMPITAQAIAKNGHMLAFYRADRRNAQTV